MFINYIGDIQGLLTLFLSYVLTVTIVGYFRAYIAYIMGDETAERYGFLSLNPVDHFDSIGFLFLVLSRYIFGFIIGWGRHVPINRDNFYGRWAFLKYLVASMSDVAMHLLLATGAMATLALLFDPSTQATVYCLAMMLLFTGTTPASLQGFNVKALPSSLMLSAGYVLTVFFYLNIFFSIISLLSTFIMNVMAFLLQRFDIERYYIVVLILVMVCAAFLGGLLKPFFMQMSMRLGNQCVLFIRPQ